MDDGSIYISNVYSTNYHLDENVASRTYIYYENTFSGAKCCIDIISNEYLSAIRTNSYQIFSIIHCFWLIENNLLELRNTTSLQTS